MERGQEDPVALGQGPPYKSGEKWTKQEAGPAAGPAASGRRHPHRAPGTGSGWRGATQCTSEPSYKRVIKSVINHVYIEDENVGYFGLNKM